MVKYIKCPRCDLNYIDSEKQEYCDVCIAELKGKKLQFADLDDEDFEEIDGEMEAEELCPVCGVNHVQRGEKMCEQCRSLQDYDEEEEVDIDKDEEWKNYLESDDEDLTVDNTLQEDIGEVFDEEEEEDEDEFYHGEDDDPLDDFDDFDDFDDEDDEDDEEEDDEDDDF